VSEPFDPSVHLSFDFGKAQVGKYLRTGDVEGLEKFEGKSIGGHALITDPDLLSSLAQAGALTLDEIYAVPEASS